MKQYALLFLAIITLFTINSCQEELEGTSIETSIEKQFSNADYLSIIANLGYSIDNIVDLDSAFLVSDIILLKKKVLEEIASKTPLTKKLESSKKLPKEQQHIYLTLLGASSNVFMLEETITQWNNIANCHIQFTSSFKDRFPGISSKFAQAEINICDNPTIGTSNPTKYSFILVEPIIPNIQYSGKVAIDTNHPKWNSLEPANQQHAITHALGLLIGLKPNNDLASIMKNANNADNNNYWQGITIHDESFLQNYYPLIPTSAGFTNLLSKYTINQDYTFHFDYDAIKEFSQEEYRFSVEKTVNNSTPIKSKSGSSLTLNFKYPGTYRIKTTIKCNGVDYTNEYYQDFVVEGENIKCPKNISLNTPFRISVHLPNPDNVLYDIDFNFIKEKHFDGNLKTNIEIRAIDNQTAEIRIKDYGHYIIDAKLKGTSKVVRFEFAKYHKFNPINVNPYDIQQIPTSEYIKIPLGDVIDEQPCKINLNPTSDILNNRLVIIKQNDYYCTTTVIHHKRVDRRWLHGQSDTLAFNANHTSEIDLSAKIYKVHFDCESPSDPLINSGIPIKIIHPDDQYIHGIFRYTTVSTEQFNLFAPDNFCKYEIKQQ